ncbi:MAG: hypothetical protein KDI09_06325 [Halioglobus sp.]|nr:hypothetical protein [Halioglobus sp.]
MSRLIPPLSIAALTGLVVAHAQAADPGLDIELEAGATWQAKNRVQIPNDSQGTRFSLTDLAGSGPWGTARLNLRWDINEQHGLRVVLAPFSYSERGRLDRDVDFSGQRYTADEAVKGSYRFNSWRVGYRYTAVERDNWRLWVGGTLKVRDAQIKLQQGATTGRDANVGVVPLLYLAAEYRLSPQWLLRADFDGLAGGPGRAFDVSLKATYELDDHWRVGIGYRGLEGGVDNDDVYNFAWFNTALASVTYRF